MTTHQAIVETIGSILQRGSTERIEEVRTAAEEYARLCAELNTQLQAVGELLHRGQRSEAIRTASESNLLDAVAILDFPQIAAWNGVTEKLGISPPPRLRTEIAFELNEAYAHEQRLQNLLEHHRAMALAGAPLSARIKTLRELADLDPDESSWRDQLQFLESHTDEKWTAAEVLADQNESLVLWLIRSGTCNTRAEFSRHFGEDPAFQTIDGLLERGVIAQSADELTLTALGAGALQSLPLEEPNPTQRSAAKSSAAATCPSCFHRFPPNQTLWIAEHDGLLGDVRLGPAEPSRFLPSRFNVAGDAIDLGGAICHRVACPNCHLEIPRLSLDSTPFMVSLVGAPQSGKTTWLASMISKLRSPSPHQGAVELRDPMPRWNAPLGSPEPKPMYNTVMFGDRSVALQRPYMFSLNRQRQRGADTYQSIDLLIYDNAGETCLPGADTPDRPLASHLALCRATFFVFDPRQDSRFANKVETWRDNKAPKARQEIVVMELAARIRRYTGMTVNERHSQPLIVVVTQYDVWWPLLDKKIIETPWEQTNKASSPILRHSYIESVSEKLRALLWNTSPDIVAEAESFAQRVAYIPVSAFGMSPTSQRVSVAPQGATNAIWAEVPLLYALQKWPVDSASSRNVVSSVDHTSDAEVF